MSKTIAIDVVLLPPEDIMAFCRNINARLWEQTKKGFLFDKTHLAHLSLAQLYIQKTHLKKVNAETNKVLVSFRPLPLKVSNIQTHSSGIDNNITVTGLDVELTPELARLHREIMAAVELFETSGDARAFLADPGESIWPGSVRWVAKYRTSKISGRGFHPHITLGLGILQIIQLTPPFIASRVAICHLGNFNTCRKILKEWQLT